MSKMGTELSMGIGLSEEVTPKQLSDNETNGIASNLTIPLYLNRSNYRLVCPQIYGQW